MASRTVANAVGRLRRGDGDVDRRRREMVAAVQLLVGEMVERAPALDREPAFPAADMAALAEIDLLAAPLPALQGGLGLGTERDGAQALLEVLRLLGRGNLSVGRLYEGHVNAARLVDRHGSRSQRERFADQLNAGKLSGIWNTERPPGLTLEGTADGLRLQGAKTFASGVDHVACPLVTATDPDGRLRLVLLNLDEAQVRVDLEAWRAQGMRASMSGRIDLGGTPVTEADLIGPPGAYHAQPDFSAGAWRFAAVQLGGLEALAEAARAHLLKAGRDKDPHQRHRMGRMAGAAETARLWVREAARIAEDGTADAESIVAYVNLARLAVERAALDVLELAHRGVGAAGFLEPHPVERLARDLAFYLRQPAPDQALEAAAAHVFQNEGVVGELWR